MLQGGKDMNTIKNIVVFDNDNCLLALLNGYCFASHIAITTLGLNVKGIKEVEKLESALVFIPIDLLKVDNTSLEIGLLRRIASASEQIKICALNCDAINIKTTELQPWIDVILNSPYDIAMIDRLLHGTNSLADRRLRAERRFTVDRRTGERRDFVGDRRSVSDKNRLAGNENRGYQAARVDRLDRLDQARYLLIDQDNKCLNINGKKIELTPKEFELVVLLSTHAGRIFTAEEIIKHLWPESDRAAKSDLYQYMHMLRKKIEKDPNNPQWLMTVKGFGYKLKLDAEAKKIKKRSKSSR